MNDNDYKTEIRNALEQLTDGVEKALEDDIDLKGEVIKGCCWLIAMELMREGLTDDEAKRKCEKISKEIYEIFNHLKTIV